MLPKRSATRWTRPHAGTASPSPEESPIPESLRARLAARERPTVIYPLLVDDPAQARKALTDEAARWRQIQHKHKPAGKAYKDGQKRLEAARKAVEDCWVQVRLRALPPAEYEQLVAAHPPTQEQADDGEVWNPDTFKPALIAACAESDMTEDDWVAFFADRASKGEIQDLFVAALGVNTQPRYAEASLGKDWTQTIS